MNGPARFWDRMAERYSKQPVADEVAYQKKLQITREYLRPDMDVLEFGCGTGSTAIAHAPYVKHIRATDVSSKMIEIARDKARAQKIENVTFERLSIDELSRSETTVDAVLALNILHLLDDKADAIAKVHQWLKLGGVFVSSTICLGDKMKFFKAIAPVGKLFGLTLKVFSANELKSCLTDAGFEIDCEWHPDESKAAFLVAKKVAKKVVAT